MSVQPDQQIQSLVRDYIQSLIFRDFSPQERLVSDRVIDSVNLVELTLFLEESFAVQISPREMNFENFDNLELIEKLILKKRTAAGSTAP